MPDAEQTEPADETAPDDYPDGFEGPFISGYGVASAALGALSVAAIALAAVIWLFVGSEFFAWLFRNAN